eukprot:30935-Pelagococcus_subviridis.AAC.22
MPQLDRSSTVSVVLNMNEERTGRGASAFATAEQPASPTRGFLPSVKLRKHSLKIHRPSELRRGVNAASAIASHPAAPMSLP